MVNPLIGDGVLSDVHSEEKWLIEAFTNAEKIKEKFKDKEYSIIHELIVSILNDEKKLSERHAVLNTKIADWKGDFLKEILTAKSQTANEIYEFFKQFQHIEEEANFFLKVTYDYCSKTRFGLGMESSSEPVNYSKLIPAIQILHDSFSKWIALDKELEGLIIECNKFVAVYNAKTMELNNYKNIKGNLDDLIKGKGFFIMHFNDRQKLLERFLRSNENEIRTQPELLKQIQEFLSIKKFAT